jgi:mRNA interferase MazF
MKKIPPMTNFKQRDIVLVDFQFSEGTASKKRPGLIVSSSQYHESRQEIIVMAITSNISRQLFGDTLIQDWDAAGLLFPSVVTGIIRTIKRSSIIRKLGTLSSTDFKKVQNKLTKIIAVA